MSEWISKEGERLKQAVASKRSKDSDRDHERQVKAEKGMGLWKDTIVEAKKIVEKINADAGSNILLWRAQNDMQIDVIAPEISQNHNVMATFNSKDCKVKWNVASDHHGAHELTGFVQGNDLLWNTGSGNINAVGAADRIIHSLTQTII